MTDQVNEAVAWPERMVNIPCPDGSGDRIVGFRIPEDSPLLGRFGLSEPLAWFRSVTIDRHPTRGVDEAMVTRYLDAVHDYLGGLTKKQWQAERQDNAAALRRAARIGLTAALEGQAAALPAAPVAMAIDPQLAAFYQVATVAELLAAQEEHIQKLQDSARRNVKPWEDTFPPTLLPKYLRDSGLTPTRNNMEQVRREAFNLADTVIEWIESGNVQAARDAIRDSLVALAALPAVPDDWVSVSERLPEEGVLVLVYVPDADGERFDQDYIEDGAWAIHNEHREHYLAVGGPAAAGSDVVCTGPSEGAPYTHWKPLRAPAATPAHDQPEGEW